MMNFYNDATDGLNTTVWITVVFTASPAMVARDSRYDNAFSYVYLDAQPLSKGQYFNLTINRLNTADGILEAGRVYVYYENPSEFDTDRNAPPYNGSFPVQKVGLPPIRIQSADPVPKPRQPSNRYSQLLEMTFAADPGSLGDLIFVDYDISAVDHISLPVYIYGGYDVPERLNLDDPKNFGCNKSYIGCASSQLVVEGCPTQLFDITSQAQSCLNSCGYCGLTGEAIQNQTHWDVYCHLLDDYATGFNIDQAIIDLFNGCAANQSKVPPCPSEIPPILTTPTNIIYCGIGQFLLENHCIGPIAEATKSRLTGAQSAAINRGVCPGPNYNLVPIPDGLSCAKFNCPGGANQNCSVPCDNFDTCFGNRCTSYIGTNQTCVGTECEITPSNCYNITTGISTGPEVPTCDSTNPNRCQPGTLFNEYSCWALTKGEFFYTFSLDEGVKGGNRICKDSTQLDIVIFPRCNGTFPGLKRSNRDR